MISGVAHQGAVEAVCVRCSLVLSVGREARGWHTQVGSVMGPLCPKCSHIVERQQVRELQSSKEQQAKQTPKIQRRTSTLAQRGAMMLQPLVFGGCVLWWICYLPTLYTWWFPYFFLSLCSGLTCLWHVFDDSFRERVFGWSNPNKFRRAPFGVAINMWGLGWVLWVALDQLIRHRGVNVLGGGIMWMHLYLTVALCAASLLLLARTALSNPGVVKKSDEDSEDVRRRNVSSSTGTSTGGDSAAAASASAQVATRDSSECDACGAVRIVRSNHCHMCGVCVSEFDKHLVQFNNCVGRNNRGLVLVTCAVIAVTHFWLMRIGAAALKFPGSPVSLQLIDMFRVATFFWESPMYVCAFYFNTLQACQFLILVYSSIMCMAKNMTSHEERNWQDLEYLIAVGKDGRIMQRSPYSKGFLSNVLVFFFPNARSRASVNSSNSNNSSSSRDEGTIV